MMVGREVSLKISKPPVEVGDIVLEVQEVFALSDRGLVALRDVSFSVHAGEIFGIAGVAGNGQVELAEVITNHRRATQGKVLINGRDMTNRSTREAIEHGVGYIPENPLRHGLLMECSVAENMILGSHFAPQFTRRWFLNFQAIDKHVRKSISEYDVKTSSKDVPARQLSGGNLQRLVLARELSRDPKLLVVAQPTHGLDVGATEYIRRKLVEGQQRGMAILLISEDLDEILSLSDWIAVMYSGEIVGILSAENTNIEEIGLMMAGSWGKETVGASEA